MTLVYPRCSQVDTFECQWKGYSVIILFSTDDDLATVKSWYLRITLSSKVYDDDEDEETAQYHYFTDDSHQTPLAEICLAGPKSADDLASYIGSPTLDKMVRNEPKTIGALFIRAGAQADFSATD